jgi:hypothetical protein
VAVSDLAIEMHSKNTSVYRLIKTHDPAASRTRSYDETGRRAGRRRGARLALAADLSSDCSKPGCRLKAARLKQALRPFAADTITVDTLSRLLCCSDAMASTIANTTFGNNRNGFQGRDNYGSVHIGTLRGRLRAVTLTIKSRTLSRQLKQDSRTS